MDRTTILCIALIICTVLAYFAGKADEKRKIQKEIAKLMKLLAIALSTQKKMDGCLQGATTKINDIQVLLAGLSGAKKEEQTCQNR